MKLRSPVSDGTWIEETMISQERCRILLPEGGVCISLNDVQTERMQIGFIGAGKVGVSLGKYFKEKGRRLLQPDPRVCCMGSRIYTDNLL